MKDGELIDNFRLLLHEAAKPKLYEAVMILFDIQDAMKIVAYVWKQRMEYYKSQPFDHDLGDYRIKSAELKHFQLQHN